jgi:hypothetical protein
MKKIIYFCFYNVYMAILFSIINARDKFLAQAKRNKLIKFESSDVRESTRLFDNFSLVIFEFFFFSNNGNQFASKWCSIIKVSFDGIIGSLYSNSGIVSANNRDQKLEIKQFVLQFFFFFLFMMLTILELFWSPTNWWVVRRLGHTHVHGSIDGNHNILPETLNAAI